MAGFIESETNRGATKEVIKWIVSQVKDKENVVGIELLNEATEDAGALATWCEFLLTTESAIDPDA